MQVILLFIFLWLAKGYRNLGVIKGFILGLIIIIIIIIIIIMFAAAPGAYGNSWAGDWIQARAATCATAAATQDPLTHGTR